MRSRHLFPFTLFLVVPACAYQQLSYQQDIKPIIDKKCNACHIAPNGQGYRTAGLIMETYDDLMRGSTYGPVVIAGDSRRSIINMLAEGRTGNARDVHGKADDLNNDEIKALRDWVDQGALDN